MSKWSFPLPQGKRQGQGSPNCWKGMHSGHFDLNRDICTSFPCQASSLWGPLEYWSLKVDWSKPTGQLSIFFSAWGSVQLQWRSGSQLNSSRPDRPFHQTADLFPNTPSLQVPMCSLKGSSPHWHLALWPCQSWTVKRVDWRPLEWKWCKAQNFGFFMQYRYETPGSQYLQQSLPL